MIFDAAASDPAVPISVIKENAPDVPIGVGIDLQKRIYVANRNGNIAICTGTRRQTIRSRGASPGRIRSWVKLPRSQPMAAAAFMLPMPGTHIGAARLVMFAGQHERQYFARSYG